MTNIWVYVAVAFGIGCWIGIILDRAHLFYSSQFIDNESVSATGYVIKSVPYWVQVSVGSKEKR